MAAPAQSASLPILHGAVCVLALLFGVSLLPGLPLHGAVIAAGLLGAGAPILFALLVIESRVREQRIWLPRTMLPALGGLVLVLAATAYQSENPALASVDLAHLFALFLLCIVTANACGTPARLNVLLLAVTLGLAPVAVHYVLLDWGIDAFAGNGGPLGRRAPVADPSIPFLVRTAVVMGVLLSAYLLTTPLRTIGTLLLVLFLYTATIHDGAVAAMLCAALAVAFATCHVLARTRERSLRVVAVVLSATVFIAAIAGMTWSGAPRDFENVALMNAVQTDARMLSDYALLGSGVASYPYLRPLYWNAFEQKQYARLELAASRPRNDVFHAGIAGGVLALGVLLWLYVRGFTLARSFAPAYPAAALISGWTLAFAMAGLLSPVLMFAVHAGLFVALLGGFEGLQRRNPLGATATVSGWRSLCILITLGAAGFSAVIASRATASRAFQFRAQQAVADNGNRSPVAEWYLKESVQLAPYDPLPRVALGRYQLNRGNSEEAAGAFQEALARNPYQLDALTGLAVAQLEIAKGALNRQDSGTDAAIMLANAQQNAETALTLCANLPEAEWVLGYGGFLHVLHDLAVAESDTGQADIEYMAAAEGWTLQALEHGWRDPAGANDLLATLRYRQERYDAAMDAVFRVLDAAPLRQYDWSLFYESARLSGHSRAFYNALTDTTIPALRDPARNADLLATLYLLIARLDMNFFGRAVLAENALQRAAEFGPLRDDVWYSYTYFAVDKKRRFMESFRQTFLDTYDALDAPPANFTAVAYAWRHGSDGWVEAIETLAGLLEKLLEEGATAQQLEDRIGWAADLIVLETRKNSEFYSNHPETTFAFMRVFVALNEIDTANWLLIRQVQGLPRDVGKDRVPEYIELLLEFDRVVAARTMLAFFEARGAHYPALEERLENFEAEQEDDGPSER